MFRYISIHINFRLLYLILFFFFSHHKIIFLFKMKVWISMRSWPCPDAIIGLLLYNDLVSHGGIGLLSDFITVFEHRKYLWKNVVKLVILLTLTDFLFVYSSWFLFSAAQKIVAWIFPTSPSPLLISSDKLWNFVDQSFCFFDFRDILLLSSYLIFERKI